MVTGAASSWTYNLSTFLKLCNAQERHRRLSVRCLAPLPPLTMSLLGDNIDRGSLTTC
jgi:hypothetical protein